MCYSSDERHSYTGLAPSDGLQRFRTSKWNVRSTFYVVYVYIMMKNIYEVTCHVIYCNEIFQPQCQNGYSEIDMVLHYQQSDMLMPPKGMISVLHACTLIAPKSSAHLQDLQD